MAEGTLTMFGKTYNTVGSADANLVLLTRGDLKIRWGNKYIDLIKNGKINADVDILKKIEDKNSIVKDGLYLIEKEDASEVWLLIGGTLVNLLGEVGTTYVSFIGTLDVDAEKRYLALINAGFYYNTFEEATNANIISGLIYVVDQQLLYYAKEGQLYRYEAALTIPDPLKIGNITIEGNALRIYGATSLGIGLGETDYISMNELSLDLKKVVVTHDIILSNTFQHNTSGYSIYYDPNREWHCMELDYLYIRNMLEFENIENITYDELVKKVEKHTLVKGKKYRITDFKNEFEMMDVYLDLDGDDYEYYWPITLTAKNDREFEKEGYFCDNEEWVIEYNINFHYYVASGRDEKGKYWIQYTKGRITKLTDEYGNVGNYDFKHRTFNILDYDIDKKDRVFTFNAPNDTYNMDEKDPLSFTNVHRNYDVTLVKVAVYSDAEHKTTVKVKNNTVYILEPTYRNRNILDENNNTIQVKELYVYDEFVHFPDCRTIYPHDNKILRTIGKFIITREFYGNTIEALMQNVKVRENFPINFNFYNNTTGTIYFIGDDESYYPDYTPCKVTFSPGLTYSGNTFGKIVNSTFSLYLTDNVFLDVKNTIISYTAERNVFKRELNWVRIECPILRDNKFNGLIDTDYLESTANRENYPITGNLIENTFNNITKCVIDGDLRYNRFNNITPSLAGTLPVIKANITYCTFNNLLGTVIFDDSMSYYPVLNYVICYNSEYDIYYDIEDSIIKCDISKTHFLGNVKNTTIWGTILDSTFNSPIGLNENMSYLGNISNSTFSKITRVDAANSTINNCEFKDEINNVTIRGTLDRCSFLKLSDGIFVGEANTSISNTDVQVNLTPSSANYRESWTDAEIALGRFVAISPLKIDITTVPKLAETTHKDCFILTITDGGINKVVFIVLLATEDNTPRGTIVMFYPGPLLSGQTLASVIPKGYHICDGTEDTPDLRGKFIRSASNASDIGSHINTDLVESVTGGRVDAIRIGVENLPPHTHTFDQATGTISGTTDAASITGIENISDVMVNPGPLESVVAGKTFGTFSDSHTHTFSGSISFTPTQLPDTFANKKIKIEPDAYALVFIMKL